MLKKLDLDQPAEGGSILGEEVPSFDEATSGVCVNGAVAPVRAAFHEEAVLQVTRDAAVPEALVAAEGAGAVVAFGDDQVVLLGDFHGNHAHVTVHEAGHRLGTPGCVEVVRVAAVITPCRRIVGAGRGVVGVVGV